MLLHRTTGTALYTTCATEAEIHRAHRNLLQAGHPARYVAAPSAPTPRAEPTNPGYHQAPEASTSRELLPLRR
ncbi:MAG: hypothetical protein ACK59A_00670 [Cyanobacteriota bacterium]